MRVISVNCQNKSFSTLSLLRCPTPGAGLLAHPGEDASGDIIVVSAPRCTLLRAAEELGLCKPYCSGDMEAFSYSDRDNFKDSGTAEELECIHDYT